MPRSSLCLVAIVAALACATSAAAYPYLPPSGKVFHGVAAGYSVSDFRARTGRAPEIWSHFVVFGGSYGYAIHDDQRVGARLMLAINTAKSQNTSGVISPGQIARGRGDGYLIRLNGSLAALGQPSYIRFLAEMNNCHVAWSSHDCSGAARDADHSAGRYKQAFRRAYLVLHGGPVAQIDSSLRALGMPALRSSRTTLPSAQVAMMWSPMTGGSPMIAALDPGVFWPGRKWVDWVATSFYSRFPNFRWLDPFYKRFAQDQRLPFAFGEWAMWGSDSASFASELYGWVHTHKRARMMIYNQGDNPDGPFRLKRFPSAARVIRRALTAPLFRVSL
jgi:hypothetical protein